MEYDETEFEVVATFLNGYQYAIPIAVIQATANKAGLVLESVEDIVEWATENMRWSELRQHARLYSKIEVDYDAEWLSCKKQVIETNSFKLFKTSGMCSSIFPQQLGNAE